MKLNKWIAIPLLMSCIAAQAKDGSGNGNGTGDLTAGMTTTVRYKAPDCGGDDCGAPDPLKAYRDKFNQAVPIDLTKFENVDIYYLHPDMNLDQLGWGDEHDGSGPYYIGMVFHLNTQGLVPTFGPYYFQRSDLPGSTESLAQHFQICRQVYSWRDCIEGDPSVYKNNLKQNRPLIDENQEIRMYSSDHTRFTLRILGTNLIVRYETCVNGSWKETAYAWADMSHEFLR